MTRTTGRRSGAAPAPSGQVRRRRGVQRWHVAVALVALALAASASLLTGVSDLTPADLLDPDEAQARVLWTSRVPRLLAILLAGSAMAVAGLVMMHLTRNRFVSPQTAGTTEWVGLGIVVATLSSGGTSVFGKMTIGVAFALVGTAFFVWLLQRLVLTDVVVVPLVGILLGGVVSAVTTFLAYRFDLLQSVDVWMNGDFSGVLAGRYELLWLVLAATVVAYLWADRFSVAGMGESFAINLGVPYTRVVMVGLAISSVVTAIVVVSVGSIPFLGLVVPNLVTLAMGDNLRRVLPVTALTGAAFVLVCDVLARTIRYPYEVPVGMIGGVVGGVLFVWLLLRARHRAV
ncbi:ABC transporter permease [Geodermatophilus obscurus]|uniref:Transport system permease protein n=1 Tax=Geodermatophilus obscurus (strain ATCC 25078 / DSM 43160 / JCM 3152 / CCUG 61914 / KCC A-0152 / KCTC 9177 / NBRC 13315 / NRRL B-3577 / G-20) TaxID=526225 RepID=D2S7X5_GEOOG|nr:iron chelate uptake ABC transporter family permease subunit [Geodermatophilus obscurus]ADB77555.1 transport system permease protein [Geodermatophilus obscurus DSM 43160]